ncbi:MAG: aminotransferase class I/II-fold pyridoxal phosphate-dependent enzyme [Myxococcota bacterium]|nr:aminotransferase class I/II-fold pyridoxal phosphate-dependent enzyme [Myxococcota bacterium]
MAALDGASLRRHLVPITSTGPVHVNIDGRPVVLFSGNDYLGLSGHPAVKRAVSEAALAHGMGPRGSALICGYTASHAALEAALAALEGAEAALLTPTGFAANLSVLSALGGEDVAIFSDALNHASIVDGCRLARRLGATVDVYRHGDVADLASRLERCERPRRVIVTDSVFSMDGDLAPLDDLATLRERFGALLVVDEAHGTLVYGPSGAGVAEHLGVGDAVDLHVGTLSKAVGALGGFVAGSQRWRDWVMNRGRAQIYSTALPLPVVAGAHAALRVARAEPEHRARLWGHVARVSEALGQGGQSPIFSVVLGGAEEALTASRALLQAGIHATAIRPPTVADGTSRLRVTLSAAHADQDIDRLLAALASVGR